VKQHTRDPHETETSGRNFDDCLTELADQRWNRAKSLALAESEGVDLTDDHWSVIIFMRKIIWNMACQSTRGQLLGRSTRIFPARAAPGTCAASSAADLSHKAAGSPICGPQRTPRTVRSGPPIEAAAFWITDQVLLLAVTSKVVIPADTTAIGAETMPATSAVGNDMSKNRLKQSFRCCSGPVLFLVSVCITLGLLFLWLDSGAGWIFIIAAGSALAAFSILGARGGRGDALDSRRPLPTGS
jgi:hypothetical protein